MIVLDDFLNDEDFANIINHPLWEANTNQSFYFKNKEDPIANIFETLIHKVVDDLLEFQVPHQGYEYWLNNLITGQNMPRHTDKDEPHLKNTGEIKSPMFGFIYYAHTEIPQGGELIIHSYDDKHESILPVPNRLVVFNSFLPHEVKGIMSGHRRSVAINIWDTAPKADENRELQESPK